MTRDLMYEDDLPDEITDAEYSRWFALSSVIDGVRMGPRLTPTDPDADPTPYCLHCGPKSACDCGPIAEND